MTIICIASECATELNGLEADAYKLLSFPEDPWEPVLRSLIEKELAATRSKVVRLLVAAHAQPCFGFDPMYLEVRRFVEAAELQKLCPDSHVVAFRHNLRSPIYKLLLELLEKKKLTSSDLEAWHRAFEKTLAETVSNFLAAWRHGLHNILNPAKSSIELQLGGVEPPPRTPLNEVVIQATKRCDDAIAEANTKRFPEPTQDLLEWVKSELAAADISTDGRFLEWHRGFRVRLIDRCNEEMAAMSAA